MYVMLTAKQARPS